MDKCKFRVVFTPLAEVDDSEKTAANHFPDTDYARTIGKISICGRDQWFSLLNKIGTILILR